MTDWTDWIATGAAAAAMLVALAAALYSRRQRRRAEHAEFVAGYIAEHTGAQCTGVAAKWCPLHGTCRCGDDGTWADGLNDPRCPLHNSTSSHATGGPDAVS